MAPGPWAPNADAMQQLFQLLRDSCTADNAQHQAIYRRFEELKQFPEFNNYLSCIMSSAQVESDIRARAGLMLKNNIRENYENMNPGGLDTIQMQAMKSLGDEHTIIRHTAGSILATIAIKGPQSGVSALIVSMCSIMKTHQTTFAVDGALSALSKICEDATDAVVRMEELGDNETNVVSQMVTMLIELMAHSAESFRCMALTTLNRFLVNMPKALFVQLDAYLNALFKLTRDQSVDVRRQICHSLCILLDIRYSTIKSNIKQIIEFMIMASADADPTVSIEANEFWSIYCSSDDYDFNVLFPFLPMLLPQLMKSMVYSEDDPDLLSCANADNENVPDRPEDIRPRFHNARGPTAAVAEHTGGAESDDTLSDDDDDASEWNLRKCSAFALDKLSTRYQNNLLPILFPLLQANLSNTQNWAVRECGVLSLGAVAEGCYTGLEPHLPTLIPYLIQLMHHDPQPLVRSISCWTMSRYGTWIIRSPSMFEQALHAILERILDRNKKVQEAACSSFATLAEEAGTTIARYLTPIVQTLNFAFNKYQSKNRLLLYDAIGSLADSCGSELVQQMELVKVLVNRVVVQWNSMADEDPSMYALLECLAYLAQALGKSFMEFAPVTFQRALSIIEQCLTAIDVASANPDADYPDKEFIVCCLDLISGLCEGIQGDTVALIDSSGERLLNCLMRCSKDQSSEIRQSAIALVGDVAKFGMPVLRPHLSQFMGMILVNLDPQYIAVCNNSSWAIGEISRCLPPNEMAPSIPSILSKIIPILNTPRISPRLAENLSITVARLGVLCPYEVGAQLEQFVLPWCYHLGNYREDHEKLGAFQGLLAVCQANPRAVLGAFPSFCGAIASWRQVPPELVQLFGRVLHGFKASMEEAQWMALFQSCTPSVQTTLTGIYSL